MERAQNGRNGRPGANGQDENGQNANASNLCRPKRSAPRLAIHQLIGISAAMARTRRGNTHTVKIHRGKMHPVRVRLVEMASEASRKTGSRASSRWAVKVAKTGGSRRRPVAPDTKRPAWRGSNGFSGDTRSGGGGSDGAVWGNYNTGNNTPGVRGPTRLRPERRLRQSRRQRAQLRSGTASASRASQDGRRRSRCH